MGKYSQDVQFKARSLYIAGEGFTSIARKIGEHLGREVADSVIFRWHERKVLGDWDEARKKLQADAAAEVHDRLLKAKTSAAQTHFDDIETLRRIWKTQLFETDAQGNIQYKQNPDGTKSPIPKAMKAAEQRARAQAYATIMGCQRIILGQDLYTIGQGGAAGGATKTREKALAEFYDALPEDFVKKIEDMLELNFSNPGEKLEDEEEADRAASLEAQGGAAAPIDDDPAGDPSLADSEAEEFDEADEPADPLPGNPPAPGDDE